MAQKEVYKVIIDYGKPLEYEVNSENEVLELIRKELDLNEDSPYFDVWVYKNGADISDYIKDKFDEQQDFVNTLINQALDRLENKTKRSDKYFILLDLIIQFKKHLKGGFS